MSSSELLNVLDKNGNFAGVASREECHSGAFFLHEVIHVLVFNSKGELLLQKRSRNKDIQPGKWDTSVGGHVSASETPEESLIRESEEELGIINASFKKIYSYIMTNNIEKESVTTYICTWDGVITHQEEEIEDIRFFKTDEIENLLGKGFFTPNFEEEWQCYKKWVKKI